MTKKINTICIISSDYPSENNPAYTFVDQLVCEFADNGINCEVISPVSISKHLLRRTGFIPSKYIRETQKGNKIQVYRPRYLSFSNHILNINTAYITYRSFRSCIIKELKKRNTRFDVIYGHFIYPSGLCTADLGKILGIPSFLAYGESSPSNYSFVHKSTLKKKLNMLSGVISVSSDNKRELLNTGLVENADNIVVFTNGIDERKFPKLNKDIARRQIGIDNNKFVVAFLGEFTKRKGATTLSNALNQLNDVHSIFIGSGPEEPKCKNILFKGKVLHDDVHIYLNASDIFVLPTQAEGCCNAIIEAMACGLPIISSDKPFNDDILNEENSIRLEVNDIEAIKKAILLLKNDSELRRKMSEAALRTASKLNIHTRAKKIIEFMNSRI